MKSKEQQLLARIMDLFAEEFGKKAILRGGMVLRILGSQRSTNDLDYVFVPYKSKNQITASIVACLKTLQGAHVQHSLNSKCLRVLVTLEEVTVQIEAKVAEEIATDLASNKLFASQYNLPPRIIPVVDHAVSMANKLAAWNERRLMRDIYDIWFFLRMSVQPDLTVLKARLRKPIYARTVAKQDYFQGKTCAEFFEFLRQKVNSLTQKEIEDELSDYLDADDCVGLALQFRSAFVMLGVNSDGARNG